MTQAINKQHLDEAIEIGTAWGEQEVEAWRDQHDGSMQSAPGWTPGTYCGKLPGNVPMDGSEVAIALEDALDDAARAIWESAWRDQHDGSMQSAPGWTPGTYCGKLPGNVPMDGSEVAIALEDAVDDAARAIWESAWRDQHDGSMQSAPGWTPGTYCGKLPGNVPMDGSEVAIALEDAVDDAARAIWESARASTIVNGARDTKK